MAWQERMMTAMSKWVSDRVGYTTTIASYDDRIGCGGGCETCYFEYAVVDFFDTTGKKVYTYDGSFAEFMRELAGQQRPFGAFVIERK